MLAKDGMVRNRRCGAVTAMELADGRMWLDIGRISRIRIHAPGSRNAMTSEMWSALIGICDALDADPEVRVVILSGGSDCFSAGADIAEFAEVFATPESAAAYNALFRRAQARLADVRVPVLASIAGPCIGGGCGMALAADLRFAGPGARLGITPSKLGIALSPEDTWQLVRVVGPARAKDILYSARHLTAEEALSVGLVDFVSAEADPEPEVLAYAETLCARSPASLEVIKQTIDGLSRSWTLPDRGAFEALFEGRDFREGRDAFLEGRKPRF